MRFEPAFEIEVFEKAETSHAHPPIRVYYVALTVGTEMTTLYALRYVNEKDVYSDGEFGYDYRYSINYDDTAEDMESAVDKFRGRIYQRMKGVFE